MACENNSDDGSISDDGSNYKIDDTNFLEGETIGRVDKEIDGEYAVNVMGPCWKWDRWQDIAEFEGIPGPDAVDPYNGPHEPKPGIPSSFTTNSSNA
eukprot:11470101-Ditylum_brightwellii.AAC.1